MVINLISSVIAGVFVPIILRKLKYDPAIAGSVLVTTITDVVGFVSFLGLAAVFFYSLLNFGSSRLPSTSNSIFEILSN